MPAMSAVVRAFSAPQALRRPCHAGNHQRDGERVNTPLGHGRRGQSDLRRILGDIVDANDEVAESIGRNLVRLSAELDALREQLVGLDRRMATLDERP